MMIKLVKLDLRRKKYQQRKVWSWLKLNVECNAADKTKLFFCKIFLKETSTAISNAAAAAGSSGSDAGVCPAA